MPIFRHAVAATVLMPKAPASFPGWPASSTNDYIIKKLKNWSKERGQDPANPDTSAIMEPMAHKPTAPQIAVVALI
jgi:hypothetical protein